MESEGYKIGCEWAQKSKDYLLFETLEKGYFDKWNTGKLSIKDWDGLLYDISPDSILDNMGLMEKSIPLRNGKEAIQFIEEHKEEFIPDDGSLDRGIVWGVMCFIKERKGKPWA